MAKITIQYKITSKNKGGKENTREKNEE